MTAPEFDLVDVEPGLYLRGEFVSSIFGAVGEAEALTYSAGRMKSRKG